MSISNEPKTRIDFFGGGLKPREQYWTLQGFESYEHFVLYAEGIKQLYGNVEAQPTFSFVRTGSTGTLNSFLITERSNINNVLRSGKDAYYYGIANDAGLYLKNPKTYDEAMAREEFVYWEEYEKVKATVQKEVLEALAKNSTAEAMKDKMVFNDRELGDFIYDRAAMGLIPELFYYSPTHKRPLTEEETDLKNKKYAILIETGTDGIEKLYFKPDHTPIVMAVRVEVEKPGGSEIEYIEIDGEMSLEEAANKGAMNVTSEVKKSYLYKQKQPRLNNAIRILIGLTRGGFTQWSNDFYGGVACGIIVETLESLGYLVSVDIVFGGGRCLGCGRLGKPLNTGDGSGRRFFTMTAKNMNENLNLDRLLYMVCDPSFHNIKLASYINCFFQLYGDVKDNSSMFWHGLEAEDVKTPVAVSMMARDMKMGNNDVMYYMIHRIPSAQAVVEIVKSIALNAENENMKLKEKAFPQIT